MVISKAGHIYVLTNDFRNNILILDPPVFVNKKMSRSLIMQP